MIDEPLARTRGRDGAVFHELTTPYRRELQLHCYRFLGSIQDAEDMVQETLLAAWRGFDRFQGRSSVRAWLYRIATNRCLNALRDRDRRPQPLPAGFTPPTHTLHDEPMWLEAIPDYLLDGAVDSPEARWESKESISLAFIATMQHLPPSQRAALLLRDVLGFRAAEVADMLDTTADSVNGALKRARSTLAERRTADRFADVALPTTNQERELAGRFADAFEHGDIAQIFDLMTEDVRFTMPPEPYCWRGRDAVAQFLSERFAGSRYRLVPTRANGQPAFGLYEVEQRRLAHAHGLLVLTVTGNGISAITRFIDNSVMARFGFPRTLRDDSGERKCRALLRLERADNATASAWIHRPGS